MATPEGTWFWRPNSIPGIEMAAAAYVDRAFPVHLHEEFVIGVITRGAERLSTPAGEATAAAGDLILLEPGAPHANQALGPEGVEYRIFYVSKEVVTRSFGEVRFCSPVFKDRKLASRLGRAHALAVAASNALWIEDVFFDAVGAIIEATQATATQPQPQPQRQVALAYDFLISAFAEHVSLTELARISGLSPYHLLRAFRAQVGLTPRAFQLQLRLKEARRRLRDGAAIAETAADLGFADQSHLTRHFQQNFGISPGRYAQQ